MRQIQRYLKLQRSYSNISVKYNPQFQSTAITLTNPKKHNPLSFQTLTEINEAIHSVNSGTKLLFMTHEGPTFSAGHDLKELSSSNNVRSIFQMLPKIIGNINSLPFPTICLINGLAAAGGLQLALAFDILLATEKSTFSTPGIKWGLFCTTPGVQLVRAARSKAVGEMLLFGEPITASQAVDYGLITRIIKEDQIETQIAKFEEKVTHLSGAALALGKKLLQQQRNLKKDDAYHIAINGMCENISLPDCAEGLKAFAEKRKPKFST